jgi:hypothetical protein
MGFFGNLFRTKKPTAKAEELAKNYLDNIFSDEKRAFFLETLNFFRSVSLEARKIDPQKYIDECTALYCAILPFAWRRASEKGIFDPKYRDTMAAVIAEDPESRCEKYKASTAAYNQAIGSSPEVEAGEAIRAVNSTFVSRIGFAGGEEEWRERFRSEFVALYDSMLDGLKLRKIE